MSVPTHNENGAPRVAGLDPQALFGGDSALNEQQTVQWLGHLQRLASTGLLAGGMAHDLAGLIQPLLGEAERTLMRGDEADYRESLVAMRAWARRCEEYVRALLDLVRRDEHHRIAVPVERVVEDTLQLLESSQRLAGVSIKRNLDNHHDALVDRTRLMQAIVNLVTNAIRAAADGGHEVEITVRGWRDQVLVEIRDNGPGVPEAIKDRLFEPFVHGDDRGGPAPGAENRTGLGLYITRRLIEEQGGRIEYETEPGVGSVFRLMLEPAPVEGAVREMPPRNEGKPLQ
jgi:two-component system NtrC family sensor kinase